MAPAVHFFIVIPRKFRSVAPPSFPRDASSLQHRFAKSVARRRQLTTLPPEPIFAGQANGEATRPESAWALPPEATSMSHSISLIADLRLRRALFAPFFFALSLSPIALAAQSAGSLGIFEGQSDVGSVVPPGTLACAPASAPAPSPPPASTSGPPWTAFTSRGRNSPVISLSPPISISPISQATTARIARPCSWSASRSMPTLPMSTSRSTAPG